MGREAVCTCRWGADCAEIREVKALLERDQLILRGGKRARIAVAEMSEIHAENEQLRFAWKGEPICLVLGREMAAQWAANLTKPPPTLARKLGITSLMSVHLYGEVDAGQDEELHAALAEAQRVSPVEGDLVIARIETVEALGALIKKIAAPVQHAPVWVIYPKGKGQQLSEAVVRDSMREKGWIDTQGRRCFCKTHCTALHSEEGVGAFFDTWARGRETIQVPP